MSLDANNNNNSRQKSDNASLKDGSHYATSPSSETSADPTTGANVPNLDHKHHTPVEVIGHGSSQGKFLLKGPNVTKMIYSFIFIYLQSMISKIFIFFLSFEMINGNICLFVARSTRIGEESCRRIRQCHL